MASPSFDAINLMSHTMRMTKSDFALEARTAVVCIQRATLHLAATCVFTHGRRQVLPFTHHGAIKAVDNPYHALADKALS